MTTPLNRASAIADDPDHPAWDEITERMLADVAKPPTYRQWRDREWMRVKREHNLSQADKPDALATRTVDDWRLYVGRLARHGAKFSRQWLRLAEDLSPYISVYIAAEAGTDGEPFPPGYVMPH